MRSQTVIQGCFPGAMPQKAPIQRLPNGTAMQLPASVPTLSARGGQPLPAAVLQKMEAVFGAKFDDVRIHVGPEPAALGARAMTRGSHIYFAPGQYDPNSAQGQRILGYELTHVVQQRAGRVANPFGSGVAVVQDRTMEAEAERMSMSAMQPRPAQKKK